MRVLFVALFVALLSACATGTGVVGSVAQDQVAAATTAWRAAYDSRDPARMTATYDADAVFWGTTAKTVAANPAAIAEYFKDAPKNPNARVAFGEQHIRVYGDVAVNTGYYTFSYTKDGETKSIPARYSFTYVKDGNEWKIVDHHSSAVPQPPR